MKHKMEALKLVAAAILLLLAVSCDAQDPVEKLADVAQGADVVSQTLTDEVVVDVCSVACQDGVCHCPSGYEYDPGTASGCRDVNECNRVNHCEENEICFNFNGAYGCEPAICPDGFRPEMQETSLVCRKDARQRCRGDIDCIFLINRNFFAIPANVPDLPKILFSNNLRGFISTLPREVELEIQCTACDNTPQPATVADFRVLPDKMGKANHVELVHSLRGPQEFLLIVNVKVFFGQNIGFTVRNEIKVKVAECDF